MGSSLNLVRSTASGDAARWAKRQGADVLPGAVAPGAQAALESLAPVDLSHLEPCRHCGAMNGITAAQCWHCEADLSAPVLAPQAIPQFAEEVTVDDSHLLPCRHCDAMNGLSATACWRCEADLSVPGTVEPIAATVHADAKPDAVSHDAPLLRNEPVHSPHLDAWVDSLESIPDLHEAPVLAARPDVESLAEDLAMLPAVSSTLPEGYLAIGQRLSEAEAIRRRRRIAVVMAGVGLLILALAASLAFREHFADPVEPPLERARAVQELGVATQPVEAAELRPVQAELPSPIRVAADPPKAPAQAEAARLGAAPVTQRVGTGTPRGTGRGAMRPIDAAVADPAPRPEPPPARPVAAPAGACTATVAALGLCSVPPSQPKE
jgi:ribosomal protein L40E